MTEGARTHADKASITWWTGSQTVNLRLSDLAPTWIVNGTSGPGSMVGRSDAHPGSGRQCSRQSVGRSGAAHDRSRPRETTTPIVLASAGETILEQRGDTLVRAALEALAFTQSASSGAKVTTSFPAQCFTRLSASSR